ncbi:MAG: resuscitation-promoting factor Rpf1 domain-containing protein, partial [Candidatus Limnocylindrales bacterium]
EVRFRSALFFQQTAKVRVAFDLPGGAPRSASDIRVGTAFATFVAWAFGDAGSVRIVVPAGFEAEATGSTAARSTSGGATIFQAVGITDIEDWYLVVNADRKTALTNDRIDLAGGEHVVIRAWPEDAEWKRRVTDLLTRGLPELAAETGLDWPVAADLTVFEVHTPLLEGYAGVFHIGEDRIEISEDLDDLTILHEASHAWFNRTLFDGRWINEGLANTYAARALDKVGTGGWAPKAVSPTDKAAVRLIDWVHPGRITDEATDAREQYGYEASWTAIETVVLEVGDAGMREVLGAAQDHRIAYVGAGEPETVAGPNDWRRLLDLLDEVGGSSAADGVFRRWVVTDAQADVLDARAGARTSYAGLATAGGDWRAPFFVRGPLSGWDFATATGRMAEATAVLARRDAIVERARALGLAVPADLKTAYEAARDSFDEANRIAGRDEAAGQALATATEAVAAPRAPLVGLGLLGTTPAIGLADARDAYEAGSPDAAAAAAAVTALIDAAVEVGRGRLLVGIALFVAIVVVLAALLLVRQRRRRRRALLASPGPIELAGDGIAPVEPAEPNAPAEPTEPAEPLVPVVPVEPASPAGPPPYATLADQSSPEPAPTDRGDAS